MQPHSFRNNSVDVGRRISLKVSTFFNADEYWQSLEVAHRAVFGCAPAGRAARAARTRGATVTSETRFPPPPPAAARHLAPNPTDRLPRSPPCPGSQLRLPHLGVARGYPRLDAPAPLLSALPPAPGCRPGLASPRADCPARAPGAQGPRPLRPAAISSARACTCARFNPVWRCQQGAIAGGTDALTFLLARRLFGAPCLTPFSSCPTP